MPLASHATGTRLERGEKSPDGIETRYGKKSRAISACWRGTRRGLPHVDFFDSQTPRPSAEGLPLYTRTSVESQPINEPSSILMLDDSY